jgi:hypothetical protein
MAPIETVKEDSPMVMETKEETQKGPEEYASVPPLCQSEMPKIAMLLLALNSSAIVGA